MMKTKLNYAVMVCVVVMLCWTGQAWGEADGATWKQWRGNDREAFVNDTSWPRALKLDLVWSVKAGASYSGPIVDGGKVFITESKGNEEIVHALSLKDGTKVWTTKWEDSMTVPFFAAKNGNWIRATPAAMDGMLYVFGMKQRLVCLDQKDGRKVWEINFPKDKKEAGAAFGGVCSPLVMDGYVYIQAGKHFYKLKGATGDVVWKANDKTPSAGMMTDGDFSSPVYVELNGKKQFVVQNRTHMYGVDPKDGSTLWKQAVPNFRGMNILTPTVFEGGVFTSTYRNGTYFYQLFKDEERFVSRKVWENKSKGYMSSPVIVGKYAYIHLGSARYSCIDLETGKTQWTSGSGNTEYSSMVTNGKLILSLVSDGKLNLIRVNPEKFEVLDSKQVSKDSSWAHVAITHDELNGHMIYVRSLGKLKVYRWKQ